MTYGIVFVEERPFWQKLLLWVGGWLVFFAILATIYYFYGSSTFTASLDGESVEATVEIDGKEVGTTPYQDRLFGSHTFRIILRRSEQKCTAQCSKSCRPEKKDSTKKKAGKKVKKKKKETALDPPADTKCDKCVSACQNKGQRVFDGSIRSILIGEDAHAPFRSSN